MALFMVEIDYTPDEQLDTLEKIRDENEDVLQAIYWGDMAGQSAGWVMVEAGSDNDARDMFPIALRDQIRIAEVNTITPDEIDAMRRKLQAA